MTKVILTEDIVSKVNGEVLARQRFHVDMLSIEADNQIMVECNDVQFIIEPHQWEPTEYDIVITDYDGKLERILPLHQLARAFKSDPERMGQFFTEYLNTYANGQGTGLLVGEHFDKKAHRTTSRTMVMFACGLLQAMAKARWTDPRNEKAIWAAKKLARFIEDEIDFGAFV